MKFVLLSYQIPTGFQAWSTKMIPSAIDFIGLLNPTGLGRSDGTLGISCLIPNGSPGLELDISCKVWNGENFLNLKKGTISRWKERCIETWRNLLGCVIDGFYWARSAHKLILLESLGYQISRLTSCMSQQGRVFFIFSVWGIYMDHYSSGDVPVVISIILHSELVVQPHLRQIR